MINSNYNEKKGIYKDLYTNIHNSHTCERESFRQRKGIYVNLYKEVRPNKNIWHEYPLRLAVFFNDVGEALRPVIGAFWAKLSWAPSLLYTFFAAKHKMKEGGKESLKEELKFQATASFLIPLAIIKLSREISMRIFKNSKYKNIISGATSLGAVMISSNTVDKTVKSYLKGN